MSTNDGTGTTTPPRHRLAGLAPRLVSHDDAVARIVAGVSSGTPLLAGFVNHHVAVLAQDHDVVHRFIDACDIVCSDGAWARAALRILSSHAPPRAPAGSVLATVLVDPSLQGDVVLIGIEPTAIPRAASVVAVRAPGLRVRGHLDGFAGDDAVQDFLDANRDVQLVLIGAGSPRSEAIALEARERCPSAVIFHCGAGPLEVLAGTKRGASSVVDRLGLHWARRLVLEPRTHPRHGAEVARFARLALHHRKRTPPPPTTTNRRGRA